MTVNYGFEHFNSKVDTAIKLSKLHYAGDNSISDSALSKVWKDVEMSFHFTKAECWKYEQEYRLDAGVGWLSDYDLDSARNPGYGFEIQFIPDDVVFIVFGVACDDHKKDGLKSLMGANEWKHVKLLEARKDNMSLKINAS